MALVNRMRITPLSIAVLFFMSCIAWGSKASALCSPDLTPLPLTRLEGASSNYESIGGAPKGSPYQTAKTNAGLLLFDAKSDPVYNQCWTCSGVRIDKNTVLTADHCVAEFKGQTDNLDIHFYPNFDRVDQTTPPTPMKLQTIPVKSNADQDWTLLEFLNNDEANKYSTSKIVVGSDLPVQDEPSHLIHHPFGGPKKRTSKDCKLTNDLGGEQKRLLKGGFAHTCESDKSSSGAPLFNSSYQLIGIHTGTYNRGTFKRGVSIIDIMNNAGSFHSIFKNETPSILQRVLPITQPNTNAETTPITLTGECVTGIDVDLHGLRMKNVNPTIPFPSVSCVDGKFSFQFIHQENSISELRANQKIGTYRTLFYQKISFGSANRGDVMDVKMRKMSLNASKTVSEKRHIVASCRTNKQLLSLYGNGKRIASTSQCDDGKVTFRSVHLVGPTMTINISAADKPNLYLKERYWSYSARYTGNTIVFEDLETSAPMSDQLSIRSDDLQFYHDRNTGLDWLEDGFVFGTLESIRINQNLDTSDIHDLKNYISAELSNLCNEQGTCLRLATKSEVQTLLSYIGESKVVSIFDSAWLYGGSYRTGGIVSVNGSLGEITISSKFDSSHDVLKVQNINQSDGRVSYTEIGFWLVKA